MEKKKAAERGSLGRWSKEENNSRESNL